MGYCLPAQAVLSSCNDYSICGEEWCRWWDSNPHAFLWAQDFKSCASAISPHRQLLPLLS